MLLNDKQPATKLRGFSAENRRNGTLVKIAKVDEDTYNLMLDYAIHTHLFCVFGMSMLSSLSYPSLSLYFSVYGHATLITHDLTGHKTRRNVHFTQEPLSLVLFSSIR